MKLFYNSLQPHEKKHLRMALSFELDHCDEPIVYERMCQRLCDIDLDLARAVSKMVGGPRFPRLGPSQPPPEEKGLESEEASDTTTGVTTSHILPSHPGHLGRPFIPLRPRSAGRLCATGISQTDLPPSHPTIATRKVAILIADGFNHTIFTLVKDALEEAGAFPVVVAPRRHRIYPSDPRAALTSEASSSSSSSSSEDESAAGALDTAPVTADHHLEGLRSTMFDALFVCPGKRSAVTLMRNGRAIHWIREAFGHLKALGAVGEGTLVLGKALGGDGGLAALVNVSEGTEVVCEYGVVTQGLVEDGHVGWGWWKIAREEGKFLVSTESGWERRTLVIRTELTCVILSRISSTRSRCIGIGRGRWMGWWRWWRIKCV